MTIGQSLILMLSVSLALLFALALVGRDYWQSEPSEDGPLGYMLSSASSQPVTLPVCMNEADRERIRSVMLDALDDALKDQVMHLFAIWMKDDRGQPDRAKVGTQNAIRAYQSARKSAEDWMPANCPG
jgi:hypothetical protein